MAQLQLDTGGLEETAFASEPGLLLARANADSIAATNEALAEFGLRVRSFAVLAAAAAASRPTQRELAAFLRLDPSQVVALVDGLERRGLVRREADPGDRRVNAIVITEAGQSLHARASRAVAGSRDRQLAALTPAEVTTLTGLLAKIVRSRSVE
ncbi:MAG TPA: MarR family transcriptional regulator [Microbacteriaceae bacterium]|nr:MarR family transcriptional regulator [Microbacteriaceae bacterium]